MWYLLIAFGIFLMAVGIAFLTENKKTKSRMKKELKLLTIKKNKNL